MKKQIGIIAGSGDFPDFVVEKALQTGFHCVVAGIKGEADPLIENKVSLFKWFDVEDIFSLISFFKQNAIKEILFAGKIDPRVIFQKKELLQELEERGEERKPSHLIGKVIDLMEQQGMEVQDPRPFISPLFCKEGRLNKIEISSEVKENIEFGWKTAKSMADMDIGQTVVVKEKTVVAVEGMEGTDQAIQRGGKLAGEGTVVVKVIRSSQDYRVDLPAVGLNTVKSLVNSQSAALCLEAGAMPFFRKQESISLADSYKISLVAKSS
ncbi:UDP-2,3-diacylglucosamine diphosphatase LpxI [bacterium]|nr:UDP-2,3-diacylglucosamine diphosphatase LpxI [bacterium]